MVIVVLALLAVPTTALAVHVEPGGATHEAITVTGTDSYGKVKLTAQFGKHGFSYVDGIRYATACSPKGVVVPGTFKGTASGAFGGADGDYAVSGVFRSTDTRITVHGSIESAVACHGSTAPVDFTINVSD